MHKHVQARFQATAPLLQSTLDAKDTSRYWHLWTRCTAKGFEAALKSLSSLGFLSSTGLPTFAHVGQPIMATQRQFPAQTVAGNEVRDIIKYQNIFELVRQARRLQNLILG